MTVFYRHARGRMLWLGFHWIGADDGEAAGRLVDAVAAFVIVAACGGGSFDHGPEHVLADHGQAGMVHQRISQAAGSAAVSRVVLPGTAVSGELNLAQLLLAWPGHIGFCRLHRQGESQQQQSRGGVERSHGRILT